MTVEWFDLGQRLHAARTGWVVPRLLHAPVPPVLRPVAVRARTVGGAVQVTAATRELPAPVTATGAGALGLLADLGVLIGGVGWSNLVTDDPATLPALLGLARRAEPDSPVAAHLAWWGDRAGFPGSSAVVYLPGGCRTRWVTGSTPAGEREPATWRGWLGVRDESCRGLLTVLDRLTDSPPLPLLDAVAEDDAWTWGKAQAEHADGWDWRRPDTPARAATGLRARCDAADLYAAALLEDPLYRQRAVHTGHVTTGTVTPDPARGRIAVRCDRPDGRLRPDNPVTGWVGAPGDPPPAQFAGTVTGTAMSGGRLALTLHGVHSNQPARGERITLLSAAPSPYAMRAGRARYARLYAARRSWLTTGRTPTPTRRDVPLDVLVAGAEDP